MAKHQLWISRSYTHGVREAIGTNQRGSTDLREEQYKTDAVNTQGHG